jgi:hypothetical protein
MPQLDCPELEQLGSLFCSSIGDVCCVRNYLKTCQEYQGQGCLENQECIGISKKSLDKDVCCLGVCQNTTSECEQFGANCKPFCDNNEEQVSAGCFYNQVCCKEKEFEFPWATFFWITALLIIIIGGAIIYLKRENLKPFYDDKIKSYYNKIKPSIDSFINKIKSYFNKTSSVKPPVEIEQKPGFPPIRRPRYAPINRAPPRDRRLDDVFDRLREMSK